MTFVGQYGGTTAAIRSAGRPCPMRPPRFRPYPLPALEAAPATRVGRAFSSGGKAGAAGREERRGSPRARRPGLRTAPAKAPPRAKAKPGNAPRQRTPRLAPRRLSREARTDLCIVPRSHHRPIASPPQSLGASLSPGAPARLIRRAAARHRHLGQPGASAAASPRLHPLLGRRAPAEQRGPSSSSECAPAPQSALLVRPLDGVPAHRRIAGSRLPRRRPEPRFVAICD